MNLSVGDRELRDIKKNIVLKGFRRGGTQLLGTYA